MMFKKLLVLIGLVGFAFFAWQKYAEIAEDHDLWNEVTDTL